MSDIGRPDDYLDVRVMDSMPAEAPTQDGLYHQVVEMFGAALGRLARAYEAGPDTRRDLPRAILNTLL